MRPQREEPASAGPGGWNSKKLEFLDFLEPLEPLDFLEPLEPLDFISTVLGSHSFRIQIQACNGRFHAGLKVSSTPRVSSQIATGHGL